MKKLCAVILAILILTSVCAGEQKGPPTSEKEKESYSIGFQFGVSINTDRVEVVADRVAEGLRDALNGKEPQVSLDEMRSLVVDLRKRTKEAQVKKFDQQVAQNRIEGEKFLEDNKKKEGIKITASGLQYKVIKEGDGPMPKVTDTVRVNYRGTFINGKEFDSSYVREEPATFQVDGVIKGWTEALQMMKVGSKWQLFIPSELAYGRRGSGSRILPNSVLIFEIELLGITKEEAPAAAEQPQPSGAKE